MAAAFERWSLGNRDRLVVAEERQRPYVVGRFRIGVMKQDVTAIARPVVGHLAFRRFEQRPFIVGIDRLHVQVEHAFAIRCVRDLLAVGRPDTNAVERRIGRETARRQFAVDVKEPEIGVSAALLAITSMRPSGENAVGRTLT